MHTPPLHQGLYEDPVLYDILHTPGTAAEVMALERIERAVCDRSLDPDRYWFEPACGTGRYLRVAARRGRNVAGFDRSEAMIKYAKKRQTKVGQGCLFVAEMTDFLAAANSAGIAAGIRLGTVAFAFNPVNSLRHLPDDAAMLAHLDQMAAILRPGGVYIVGISLTDYDQLWPEEDLWEGARGNCRVRQLVNYLPPEPGTALDRIERVVSHLTVERPSGEEHIDDIYELRSYDQKQWRDLVSRSRLELVDSFGGDGQPLADHFPPYQLEVLVNSARS